MTSERIKQIQETTAYPESVSVQQALLQVWNECGQHYEQQLSAERKRAGKLVQALEMCLQALRVLDAKDFVAYTAGKVALIEYKQTLNEYDTATKI